MLKRYLASAGFLASAGQTSPKTLNAESLLFLKDSKG